MVEKWSKFDSKTSQNGSLKRNGVLFFFEDRVWQQHGPKWLDFGLQIDPQNRWKIDVIFDTFFGTLPKRYSNSVCVRNDLQSGPFLTIISNIATMRFCCYLLHFGTISTFQLLQIFTFFLERVSSMLRSLKKSVLHRFWGSFFDHFGALFRTWFLDPFRRRQNSYFETCLDKEREARLCFGEHHKFRPSKQKSEDLAQAIFPESM